MILFNLIIANSSNPSRQTKVFQIPYVKYESQNSINQWSNISVKEKINKTTDTDIKDWEIFGIKIRNMIVPHKKTLSYI